MVMQSYGKTENIAEFVDPFAIETFPIRMHSSLKAQEYQTIFHNFFVVLIIIMCINLLNFIILNSF